MDGLSACRQKILEVQLLVHRALDGRGNIKERAERLERILGEMMVVIGILLDAEYTQHVKSAQLNRLFAAQKRHEIINSVFIAHMVKVIRLDILSRINYMNQVESAEILAGRMYECLDEIDKCNLAKFDTYLSHMPDGMKEYFCGTDNNH